MRRTTWGSRVRGRRGPLALVGAALLLGALLTGCAPTSGAGGAVLAASVNGHGIPLSQYQGLLNVYETSSIDSAEQQGQAVSFAWQSTEGRPQLATAAQGTMDFLVTLELAREQLKHPVAQKDLQSAYKSLQDERNQLLKSAPNDPAALAFAQSLTPDTMHLLAEQQATTNAAMANATVPSAHLRIILVKTQAQAKNLQQQAEHGADFGQLAHNNNTDSSLASSNGDLPQSTYYPGQIASGTPTQKDIDQAIFGAGARNAKYVILPIQGQWALIEVTQRADKKLSTLNDQSTEQTVFQAWLSDIVRPAAHVDDYITLG